MMQDGYECVTSDPAHVRQYHPERAPGGEPELPACLHCGVGIRGLGRVPLPSGNSLHASCYVSAANWFRGDDAEIAAYYERLAQP
jgi:hypothetical protein